MSEFLDNLNYDEFTSAEFERWAKSEGYSLKIMDSGWATGKYASTETRMLWKTWQASRESYSTVALMGAEIKRLEFALNQKDSPADCLFPDGNCMLKGKPHTSEDCVCVEEYYAMAIIRDL